MMNLSLVFIFLILIIQTEAASVNCDGDPSPPFDGFVTVILSKTNGDVNVELADNVWSLSYRNSTCVGKDYSYEIVIVSSSESQEEVYYRGMTKSRTNVLQTNGGLKANTIYLVKVFVAEDGTTKRSSPIATTLRIVDPKTVPFLELTTEYRDFEMVLNWQLQTDAPQGWEKPYNVVYYPKYSERLPLCNDKKVIIPQSDIDGDTFTYIGCTKLNECESLNIAFAQFDLDENGKYTGNCQIHLNIGEYIADPRNLNSIDSITLVYKGLQDGYRVYEVTVVDDRWPYRGGNWGYYVNLIDPITGEVLTDTVDSFHRTLTLSNVLDRDYPNGLKAVCIVKDTAGGKSPFKYSAIISG